MKQNLFVALAFGLVLFLMSGASDAVTPEEDILMGGSYIGLINGVSGPFVGRFKLFEAQQDTGPKAFMVDRKTGCEYLVTKRGDIVPLTTPDQCPKENIRTK